MIDRRKHIVFITPGFASSEADDYTISALQIYCKKLQEREDILLSIITLHFPNTKKPYQWYNCKVYPLGFKNKKISILFSRKVNKILKTIHKQHFIDYLHSFWLGECAFIGHRFSKKYNINHLITLMGQDAIKGNKYAKIMPLKNMKIVALSDFQQDLFFKNYKVSSTIIPWGIDKELTPFKTKKTIDIIGIGSFISLKNYSDFIKTISLLKKKKITINATLVGDGKLKIQLLKQINDLGLSEIITVTGMLSYSETQQLLAKSKILLHPSIYESFGMVFAEALANNVFIVSQKVGLAKACDYWKIGNTPKLFSEGCQDFLNLKSPEISTYPNVKITVDEYLKLYNLW